MTPHDAHQAGRHLAQLYRHRSNGLLTALRLQGINLMHHCPVLDTQANPAPSIEQGVAAFTAHVKARQQLVVSKDFCSDTIYSSETGNHWFRFVHDMGHMLYQCEFDAAGETELHRRLWNWIETTPFFWSLTKLEQQHVYCVYKADTQGQTDYFEQHGEFPADQRAFVTSYATEFFKSVTGAKHAQA